MRLNRLLSDWGVTSRRDADRMIESGRLTVNGSPATLGLKVIPASDKIELDKKVLHPPTKTGLTYLLLNKPPGYLTTLSDDHGRTTIVDLIPKTPRLFPVGRLDLNTAGLLLMTDDGEMAHRLMHPSYEIPRVYKVHLFGYPGEGLMGALEAPIVLEDGIVQFEHVRTMGSGQAGEIVEVTLREGHKREVRRAFESLGSKVAFLERVSFAGLRVGSLRRGRYRYLTGPEIERLKRLVNLK